MTASNPATVVESYLASFATGDPATIAAHVTDDFLNVHTSALGSSCKGRAAYLDRLPQFLGIFLNLSYEVEEIVNQDDRVCAAYMMRASVDGDPIVIRGVMRFVLRNSLISERIDYFDSLTFLQQTGQA